MAIKKRVNEHEKLVLAIKTLLIDITLNLPFYGEFNLHVNFEEQESVGTCGVNVTAKGMNFYYSPSFLDGLSQKEVNFIVLHEDFHLLFNHPKRTVTGQYNHKLANIAQDMIINHTIWEDISHEFVEIPRGKDGKNMALFVPIEYKGNLIFEELYEFLKDRKDKRDQEKKKADKDKKDKKESDNKSNSEQGEGEKLEDKSESQNGGEETDKSGSGQGEQSGDSDSEEEDDGLDSSGKPSYGPFGKNPRGRGALDTFSLDKILDDLDTNNGEYLDRHMVDEVPEEYREGIIKDITDRLASRGLVTGDVQTTLNKLKKKRKDYLKEIKRSISNSIFGGIKRKTITRPNRRQIPGLKGVKKKRSKINVILDTSGSMGGRFERVLSYVYRNDIEINLMESDTEVKWVENIKNKKKLDSIPIKGLGGTTLNPAIEYVRNNFNNFNTVILTDGMTDRLDFSGIKGNVLIISIAGECPIAHSNGKIKQICIGNDE